MPRQTRSARRAEAAAAAPPDNVAVDAPEATDMHASAPVPDDHNSDKTTDDRAPLSELEANNVDAPEVDADAAAAPVKKMPPKRSKSKKGGKKGAKGKKAEPEESVEFEQHHVNGQDEDGEEAQIVLEDERQTAGSPASDAAREELVEPPSDSMIQTQIPMNDMRPPTPPSPAVRLTRRQLAKQDELSKSQRRAAPPGPSSVPEEPVAEDAPEPELAEVTEEKPAEPLIVDATVGAQEHAPMANGKPAAKLEETTGHVEEEVSSEVAQEPEPQVEQEEPLELTAEPKESSPEEEKQQPELEMIEAPNATTDEHVSSAEADSQAKPETAATENPESGRATPAACHTPAAGSPKSPARSAEESTQAMGDVKETLENVVPKTTPAAEEAEQSPPESKPAPAPKVDEKDLKKAVKSTTRKSMNPTAAKSTKSSSRVSVAPSARQSMAPTARSSRPSVAPSARQSTATSARVSLARSSSVRASSARDPSKKPSEVPDYLASKRRPISISFPTPPPPPKNTKPPTRPTFQLPGEAIAAKLKAQKEERLKREAEREQEGGPARPRTGTVSRAPVVKSTKPPTKSNFQLPGEAVAAKLKAQREERLKREAEGLVQRPASATFKPPPPPKSSKPPTKPNFQLPGEAVAAKLKAQREERLKREQEAAEAAKEKDVRKPAFKARPAPTHKAPAVVRQTAASKARESLMNGSAAKKDDDSSTSTSASKAARRISSAPSSTNPTASKRASTTQTKAPAANKGHEAFSRDKKSADQIEKERKEKEEAAKKARAEAAERGRQASREWAERQRKKMLAAKAAQAKTEPQVTPQATPQAEPLAEEKPQVAKAAEVTAGGA